MRTAVFLVAVGILVVFAVASLPPSAAAQVPTPRLYVTVQGESVDGAPVFVPNRIVIPQVPIVLNITFVNNDVIQHTFTIDSVGRETREVVSSGYLDAGANWTAELTIQAMDNVTFGTTTFNPEEGEDGIRFYCIPHRVDDGGMVGEIVLATAAGPAQEPPEKGINIRAYWIGMIGIAATIGWIGISYFVIKSSSPRFRDHGEHRRRGLP